MKLCVDSSDEDLLSVISAARSGEIDEAGIASLAQAMAASGEMLPNSSSKTADVPSTGGPASLSTLLCPLFLKTLGWKVPKLGVPGRPAGGLDVLSQIPGYKVDLSVAEASRVIDACGYAHFAGGTRIAPLDARIFALRQRTRAQAVPALVIASLLAKKLAVGVKTIGLDVRVAPHGNFGADMAAARDNARVFCRVAAHLNMDAICVLTDATRPYQPYIGRGESLLALFRLFSGDSEPSLRRHADQCAWIAAATVGVRASPAAIFPAQAAFIENVMAQGGAAGGFEAMAKTIESGHKYSIVARRSGFLVVDLERLRNVIVTRQRGALNDARYPDSAGVILVADCGSPVDVGDPVLTARVEGSPDKALEELDACISISDTPPSNFGEKVCG
jgi:thymidine phosphorylase